MKIFISKTFDKKYLSKIKNFNLSKFLDKIKSSDFIILKTPYFKLKFNINWISYRWVVLKTNTGNLIPLVFCLKKDKNCWENIIWQNSKLEILKNEKSVLEDIKNNNFEIF